MHAEPLEAAAVESGVDQHVRRSGRPLTPRVREVVGGKVPWGTYAKARGTGKLECPEPACTKTYARADQMVKHVKTTHGWDAARAREAFPNRRRDQCPHCGKWMSWMARHLQGCRELKKKAERTKRRTVHVSARAKGK